jgi:hypothetical protein
MAFVFRLFAVGIFSLLLSLPAMAASVCVLVVESGLPADSMQPEASSAWEAGMMDAFFNAGHIVWNESLYRASAGQSGKGPVLPATSFRAEVARTGGADYLALAVLDYGMGTEESMSKTRLSPIGVAFRLIDLGSGVVLTEGSDVTLKKTASGEEETREAGKVARIMMTRLKER